MSSELTHISAIQISNYATLDALKVDIIKTLARWFPNNYVYDENRPLDSWAIREETEIDILCNGTFQFELLQVDIQHVYELTMYGVGRYRRHGSSCDFFERIFDSLEQQLKHPSPPFATMLDAHQASVYENRIVFGTPFQYTHSNSALPLPGALAETVVYDEEEGLDEEAVLREDDYYNDRNGGYGGNDGGYFGRDDYGGVLDNDGMVLDVGAASLDSDEILLTTEDAGILSDEDSEDEEDSDDESEEDSDDESSVDSDEEDELIMSMPLRDMTDNQIDRYIDLSGQEPRDEIKEWSSNFRGGAIPRYSYINFADAWITDQNVSNVTIRRARFAGCTLRNFQFEQVHFHECDFNSVTLENVTFKDCQFTECDLATYMSLDNSCSVENFDYEDERLEDNVTYRYC
jgi:hypothetical protein